MRFAAVRQIEAGLGCMPFLGLTSGTGKALVRPRTLACAEDVEQIAPFLGGTLACLQSRSNGFGACCRFCRRPLVYMDAKSKITP